VFALVAIAFVAAALVAAYLPARAASRSRPILHFGISD
jgi:hypothetical protein